MVALGQPRDRGQVPVDRRGDSSTQARPGQLTIQSMKRFGSDRTIPSSLCEQRDRLRSRGLSVPSAFMALPEGVESRVRCRAHLVSVNAGAEDRS